MTDLIDRQAVIDALNDGAELLRRVLDDTDIVGVERAKYAWGLGLIESYISDVEELPSEEPEITRCKDCKYRNGETKGCVRNPCVEPWRKNDFCSYGEKVTE